MWPTVCRHCLGFTAALSTGWAIRLLDDALDCDLDSVLDKLNWSRYLGRGTTAYALYAFTIGVLLQPVTALCLLIAAYNVGMLGETRILPTRLPAYLEGAFLWALAWWRCGFLPTGVSFGIMLLVQLLDDMLDSRQDQRHKRNWSSKLGTLGSILAVIALSVLLFSLERWLFCYAMLSFILFQSLERVVKQ